MHLFGRRGASATPDSSSSLREIPREVFVLAFMSVLVALGFGIVAPAIPLLADYFGVGHTVAGMAISGFALARFASAFANARAVEILGERPVLITGLFVQAVMMVLAGFAPNYWLVILARVVAGVGSAAFSVSAMSLVLRITPAHLRGRAASVYQGGFLVGAVGGPAIGGVITDINPRLPFIIYGICLGAAGLVIVFLLPRSIADAESDEQFADPVLAEHNEEGQRVRMPVSVEAGHPPDHLDDRPDAPPSQRALGLRSRAFLAACAVNLANGWVLYGVRNSLVPSYVVDVLGHSATWMGMAFFIASIIQILALVKAGQWTDSWGRKPVMIIGATLALAGSALLLPPGATGLFLMSMISMGAAAALLSSAPAAVVGDVTQGHSGRGIALFSMASDFGGVMGPVLAGLLADELSFTAAYVSCAVVCSIAVVAALLMQETLHRADEHPAPSLSGSKAVR